jgi:hypothetical protein
MRWEAACTGWDRWGQKARAKLMTKQKTDWFQAIKDIRAAKDCDILAADRIALNDPDWRRWVEVQINRDPDCQKMARRISEAAVQRP